MIRSLRVYTETWNTPHKHCIDLNGERIEFTHLGTRDIVLNALIGLLNLPGDKIDKGIEP